MVINWSRREGGGKGRKVVDDGNGGFRNVCWCASVCFVKYVREGHVTT